MNSKLEGTQEQVTITIEKGNIKEKFKNKINNEIYILFQTFHMLKKQDQMKHSGIQQIFIVGLPHASYYHMERKKNIDSLVQGNRQVNV